MTGFSRRVNALTAILVLSGHAAVVAAAAWLVVRGCLPARAGGLERLLAWGWSGVAIIAANGVLLGALGGLGPAGFWVADLAVLLGLAALRRAHRREDAAALRALGGEVGAFFRAGGMEAWLATLLLVLLGAMLLLSLWAEPVVYDALTYRLPRIGQWLQDGRIGTVVSDEPRITYMPVVPDLVMAWCLAIQPTGWQFGAVAQALGGGLAAGATVGLARLTGLSRASALGAGLLLFSMANVAPQFTSAHTDLFTTGALAAAFYLWLAALRRGEGSLLGGAGAGLALGAKGTVFYLAPGALLWVAWLAWRHRLPLARWWPTVLAAVLGGALFAGPVFVRNRAAYGGWFGPPEHVRMHHGAGGMAAKLEKLPLNLRASLAQLFEPNSQPPWWRSAAREIGAAIAATLPEHDEYTLEGISRRGTLGTILARSEPDADATSFGVLASGLFAFGFIAALLHRRRPDAALVAVWSLGIVVFLVFFHAMQQWHPYGFRYFVLVAPWLAVVAAWGLREMPRPAGGLLWGVAGLTVAVMTWSAIFGTYQSGWRAIAQPENARGYFVARQWAAWAQALDRPESAWRVALPDRRPIAAFYRGPAARAVELRPQPRPAVGTAEDLAKAEPGWVIVPAARFIGREGRVLARTWLFEGAEDSPFSLAAYRALGPGELPAPVLYRQRQIREAAGARWDLLVKVWTDPVVVLRLENPGASAWSYRIDTAAGRQEGELAAGASQPVTLALPVDAVSQVLVTFHAVAAPDTPVPRVTLADQLTR